MVARLFHPSAKSGFFRMMVVNVSMAAWAAPRRERARGRAWRASRAAHQLQERVLVQRKDAEAAGLVGLGAGILADHDVVGLLRDAAGDPPPQTQDEVLGLIPRQRPETAGE